MAVVHPSESKGLSLIDQALAAIAEETPSIGGDHSPTTHAEAIIERLMFLVGAVQRVNRIAISQKTHWQRVPAKQDQTDPFYLAFPSHHHAATTVALEWSVKVINDLNDGALTLKGLAARKAQVDAALAPYSHKGVNQFNLLNAAFRNDIPVSILFDSLIRMGTGCRSRQWISTITDKTPSLGVSIATDKYQTAKLLRLSGLPGSVNHFVYSEEDAIKAAESMGFPVVIKPNDLEQGVGVAADLRTTESVRKAYRSAKEKSSSILIEKHFEGQTHRLTVVHGEVIRIVKRIAGGVVGDGLHTIHELIDRLENDQSAQQKSTARRHKKKKLVDVDDETLDLLKQNGFSLQSVPAKGEYIKLRRRDNINAGGRNEEIEVAKAHPDNLILAQQAANALGLDIAGIDLITQDIRQSWLSSEVVICEINAQPQIGARSPTNTYDQLLRKTLGPITRIPAELILCIPEDSIRRSLRDQLTRKLGGTVCIADRSGLWETGRRFTQPFVNDYAAALAAINSREVGHLVCLMDPKEIAESGSPLDQWDRISTAIADPDAKTQSVLRHAMALLTRTARQ
jgi:cyanophycin synthetase